jgi:uncharacterized membrane protein
LQKLLKNFTPNNLFLGSASSLIALIFLNLFWEICFNPIHSKTTWMVLKSVILLVPLVGILKKDRYTFQWSSMFIVIFFIEGVVRYYTDISPSKEFAFVQINLTILFFLCSIYYCKKTR